MIREVLRYPHPDLKRVAAPVGDGDVSELIADLLDTMRSFPRCVGLAAPQIGDPRRVCIVDCSQHPKATDHHGLLVLIDPEVVESEGTEVGREGCLSIPDLTANVRRPVSVVVSGLDAAGAEMEVSTEGFEARCLLHEIDHLDGVLFLDRVDSLARDVFRRKSYR